MPITIQENVFEGAQLGVWEICEEPAYFLDRVTLTPLEQDVVNGLSAVRLREWLASRYLLKVLLNAPEPLETDSLPTGKPFLVGRSEEISLSHSGDYVAVMVGQGNVGVDIQKCKEKISKLEHKFARPEESAGIDRSREVLHLHLLWGAKEALYKIYARKSLDFIANLHVDLPTAFDTQGTFTGQILVGTEIIPCLLRYRIFEPYVLVYGQESP